MAAQQSGSEGLNDPLPLDRVALHAGNNSRTLINRLTVTNVGQESISLTELSDCFVSV